MSLYLPTILEVVWSHEHRTTVPYETEGRLIDIQVAPARGEPSRPISCVVRRNQGELALCPLAHLPEGPDVIAPELIVRPFADTMPGDKFAAIWHEVRLSDIWSNAHDPLGVIVGINKP